MPRAPEMAGHKAKLVTVTQSDVYAVLEKRLRKELDDRETEKKVETAGPSTSTPTMSRESSSTTRSQGGSSDTAGSSRSKRVSA